MNKKISDMTNKIVTKIAIIPTLRAMGIGNIVKLDCKDVTLSSIRISANKLKKEGEGTYSVSEKNRGFITITRLS